MITIWDKIFETLWSTCDIPTMKLGAALLSDKKQLQCWWYRNQYSKGEGMYGICSSKFWADLRERGNDYQINWGSLKNDLSIPYVHTNDANEYLIQAYKNWKHAHNME